MELPARAAGGFLRRRWLGILGVFLGPGVFSLGLLKDHPGPAGEQGPALVRGLGFSQPHVWGPGHKVCMPAAFLPFAHLDFLNSVHDVQ